MKKFLKGLMFSAILVCVLTANCFAARSVNAEISPFSLNIVFTPFYNNAAEYPVLLYKNVTYIPLTSAMCNELYLSIAFTPEDGLYVARGGGRGEIGKERKEVLGRTDYANPADGRITALIPEYPVYINGRQYDSQNGEYPMLNFRDITYLPLTHEIFTKEFDFHFVFDNYNKSVTLHGNSWYSSPYFTNSCAEYIELTNPVSVYTPEEDENGGIRYRHQYSYNDYHRLYLENERFEKLPPNYTPTKSEQTSQDGNDPRIQVIENEKVLFEGEELMKLQGYGYGHITTASAQIYDYEDISFIVVTSGANIALPRGTTRQRHIFIKDENGITKLDWTYTFNGIIYDGKGAWYLCSSSGNQMYGNYFAEIYRYTRENGLERLSDRYENLNSLEYIGSRNGKMYVFAALRTGDREAAYSGNTLNPMYSGYYEIDENLNIRKISPYIGSRASVVLAENGTLYAITNNSRINRLINLNTGRIIVEI